MDVALECRRVSDRDAVPRGTATVTFYSYARRRKTSLFFCFSAFTPCLRSLLKLSLLTSLLCASALSRDMRLLSSSSVPLLFLFASSRALAVSSSCPYFCSASCLQVPFHLFSLSSFLLFRAESLAFFHPGREINCAGTAVDWAVDAAHEATPVCCILADEMLIGDAIQVRQR
ncbi:hypothetical protein TGRUB_432910 [Toxoplasma gondii RUB]|uniref:Uncharacterized protein n=1 Tax=Toxoplasma gondii RUB TaxID=935652 RepID=A0A086LPC1_TOXGO|nr:hypothetical protein TGRUB_432910 [Toxoplasma gondii RUB]